MNGSRVGVVGGGPAGSFFAYFLLELASRVGLELEVDVYEPRDFSRHGPAGCNHCGGIVSESLIQKLAAEGIHLPRTIVQRGIDSYVLHTEQGAARIETPLHEKRIAAIYRGAGPLDATWSEWGSFDRYLLDLAAARGARLVSEWVKGIDLTNGRPRVELKGGSDAGYDLVVNAVGVNFKVLNGGASDPRWNRSPTVTKTYICEYLLGREVVARHLGASMHIFLLDIPRLEFAALVPKGEYVTLVLLGRDIDRELVRSFCANDEVTSCFPRGWDPIVDRACKCFARINTSGAPAPFADRFLAIGDRGATKLYKDGIGSAYATAKAAATTAIFQGISAADFARSYGATYRRIARDNAFGRVLFAVTRLVKKRRILKRWLLRAVRFEQSARVGRARLSAVLWDLFTGSDSYRTIFYRTLRPTFWFAFVRNAFSGKRLPATGAGRATEEEGTVIGDELGTLFRNGEAIINQGEVEDCMYVIQSGVAEVVQQQGDREVLLAQLGEDDFFGEMALFERGETRSATVRAVGEVRVLTIEKSSFLRQLQEDPSLGFRIIEKMSSRIRRLDDQLGRLSVNDAAG